MDEVLQVWLWLWGRRKEKGVKSVYKVPPKEDKSVAEIMYDLQMAALDEVD